MSESIVQNERCCLVCRTTQNLERHHIFGAARRPISEETGLWVWLCHEHHTGVTGVHSHKGHQLMEELHELGQMCFEEKYGHNVFIERFGKNYIQGDNDEQSFDDGETR